MVAWLLGKRANARKQDLKGLTPIDRAALAADPRNDSAQSFPAIARRLLAHGAEVTIRAAVGLADAERIRELVAADPGCAAGDRLADGRAADIGGEARAHRHGQAAAGPGGRCGRADQAGRVGGADPELGQSAMVRIAGRAARHRGVAAGPRRGPERKCVRLGLADRSRVPAPGRGHETVAAGARREAAALDDHHGARYRRGAAHAGGGRERRTGARAGLVGSLQRMPGHRRDGAAAPHVGGGRSAMALGSDPADSQCGRSRGRRGLLRVHGGAAEPRDRSERGPPGRDGAALRGRARQSDGGATGALRGMLLDQRRQARRARRSAAVHAARLGVPLGADGSWRSC
jgi:hypothetical protein